IGVAARRTDRGGGGDRSLVPPLSRNFRPPPARHGNGALARMGELGGPGFGRAFPHFGWRASSSGQARLRYRLGRGRSETSCAELVMGGFGQENHSEAPASHQETSCQKQAPRSKCHGSV